MSREKMRKTDLSGISDESKERKRSNFQWKTDEDERLLELITAAAGGNGKASDALRNLIWLGAASCGGDLKMAIRKGGIVMAQGLPAIRSAEARAESTFGSETDSQS